MGEDERMDWIQARYEQWSQEGSPTISNRDLLAQVEPGVEILRAALEQRLQRDVERYNRVFQSVQAAGELTYEATEIGFTVSVTGVASSTLTVSFRNRNMKAVRVILNPPGSLSADVKAQRTDDFEVAADQKSQSIVYRSVDLAKDSYNQQNIAALAQRLLEPILPTPAPT